MGCSASGTTVIASCDADASAELPVDLAGTLALAARDFVL
jgi:hypothetical protein